jgi:hypothetical protein
MAVFCVIILCTHTYVHTCYAHTHMHAYSIQYHWWLLAADNDFIQSEHKGALQRETQNVSVTIVCNLLNIVKFNFYIALKL